MNIYLAAPYSQRREELGRYAAELREQGHTVTSRWHEGHRLPLPDNADELRGAATIYAGWDMLDIIDADLFITFTSKPMASETLEAEPPMMPHENGGTHVEFGYALALGKSLWIVGPQENIFHLMNGVRTFDTWEKARAAIKEAS